ncbi:hypothetical protein NUU61_004259 [Penicillium alfredii]|uniref:Uncharacterized protein n=1 Tax=Penicillium alfredii TaxID=1506179 RepID=A0A9W9FL86_9EURO|nr:uncharacterized protein NUU61_004259 [Penicillium alfredii]KAJ5102037.1 hypothetical protein NUU61_004259 [Penicillium alfredii]
MPGLQGLGSHIISIYMIVDQTKSIHKIAVTPLNHSTGSTQVVVVALASPDLVTFDLPTSPSHALLGVVATTSAVGAQPTIVVHTTPSLLIAIRVLSAPPLTHKALTLVFGFTTSLPAVSVGTANTLFTVCQTFSSDGVVSSKAFFACGNGRDESGKEGKDGELHIGIPTVKEPG